MTPDYNILLSNGQSIPVENYDAVLDILKQMNNSSMVVINKNQAIQTFVFQSAIIGYNCYFPPSPQD